MLLAPRLARTALLTSLLLPVACSGRLGDPSVQTGPTNTPPRVDAGADVTAFLGGVVQLAGSTSDDGLPVGGAPSVHWLRIDGPEAVTFSDSTTLRPVARFAEVGVFTLRLVASDGALESSDDVVITIRDGDNAAPSVVVDATRRVTLPETLTLTATVSDDGRPDGAALAVTWSQASGPATAAFAPAAGLRTTITFPAPGRYVLRADVTDGQLSASASSVVDVEAAHGTDNQAPLVSAGPSGTVERGAALTLRGTASDDGLPSGALTTAWVMVSGPGRATFTDAARAETDVRFDAVGTFVLRLTASDGELEAASETVVEVTAPADQNDPPVVDVGVDQSITLPAVLHLAAVVTDDGRPGGALSTTWTQVSGPGTASFVDASAVATEAVLPIAGTYVLRLTASDGLASASDELVVTAAAPPPVNQAPAVSAGADLAVTLPQTASLGGAVSDDGLPAGSSVTTTWSTVSGPGTVRFTDAARPVTTASFTIAGSYVLRLTATDGALTAQDDVQVVVTAAPPMNGAPVVSAGQDQVITLPSNTQLRGTATDDGLPSGTLTVRWTRVSGPGTVTFWAQNSPVTTAVFPVAGVYVLRLTADDGALSSSSEVTVTVRAAPPTNQAPTVSAGTPQTITLPAEAQLTGTTSDDGLPAGSSLAVTWSTVSGPGAVTFSAPNATATRARFAAAGTYVLRLTATDGQLSAQASVTVTVNAAPVNQAPIVGAGADQIVTLPASATLDGTASDDGLPAGNTLAATWSRVSGPGTVTFGSAAAIDTTASFSAAGTYVLRLTVSDGALSAQDDVSVVVRAPTPVNQAPSVSAGSPQSVTLPQAASLRGSASDDGLPVGSTLVTTWSRVSGPGAVTFGSTSQPITSATFASAGTYVLRLSATDGALSAQSDVTITVTAAPVNQAPIVDAGPSRAVTLPQSASLDGTVSDDGLPAGNTLVTAWSRVSGPGTVTFGAVGAVDTTASFSAAGTYVLRLTANDGALVTTDDVTVTVTSAPPSTRTVLMFVGYNDVWWPEYKVMYEGLRAAGYTVDVRSSALGSALADYSAPVDVTPSAQPLHAPHPAPSSYAAFTSVFQTAFGRAWDPSWNAITPIPIAGRLQDVTSLAGYDALVIPGGRGLVAYRFDGTYADSSPGNAPGTHVTTAAEVRAAAERLAALAQEALQTGKPVVAQCHASPTLAFVRVPGTTGQGFDGLGRSILQGRYATGYTFSNSDTLARYQDLGVTPLRYEKAVIDGPEAPDFGGNGRDMVVTTADWYPETTAYATRTLLNMLDTVPSPARRTRALSVLVFGGDEPTLYAPDQPARYTDLVTLLNDPSDDLAILATGTANVADITAANLANYDALVYFRHDRIAQAAQTAIVDYVDGGGGLVALHHAVFDEGGAKGTLTQLIGASLGSAARPNDPLWLLYANETNHVINVNYGHFVSTWGVHLLAGQPTQSVPYVTPRGYPNPNLDNDTARGYWSFRIPANDELYPGVNFVSGVSFGRGVNQIERLFSNDHVLAGSPNTQNGAYDAWGFVRRYDGRSDGTVGRVVYAQPGETAARTLAHPSYRQVVKNAVIWSAR